MMQNLIFNSLLTIDSSIIGEKILVFTSNAYANTFDPDFEVTSGTLNWHLGDSSVVNANSFEHTYTGVGNKTVQVYSGTTNGSNDILYISLYDDNIVGNLDISSLNLLNTLAVNDNPNLTSIISPISPSMSSISYFVYDCDLTGTLDISGLTTLGPYFRADYNPNLTSILNPSSSQSITNYFAYDCSLTGVLDISGLTGLGGSFRVSNNLNLTSILNPISSQAFLEYHAINCNLTGTLDISGLTGLGGYFYVYDNLNLTSILLPTLNSSIYSFYAHDCSLTTSAVDDILSKIYTYYSSHTPDANVYIYLDGGTNAAPTNGWDNTSIQGLYSIFSPPNDISIKINVVADDSSIIGEKLLTFTTEASSNTFNATLTASSGTLNWHLGDGSVVNTNEINHTYTTPGEKVVQIYSGTTDGSSAIEQVYINNNDLIGTLDISNLSYVHSILLSSNPKLTSIISPISVESSSFTYIALDSDLTGTLDISSLTNLKYFSVGENPNLTQILNPASSSVKMTYYSANQCNLTGTLDLTGLTGLGGLFYAFINPNLTSILFPNSSEAFDTFYVHNNPSLAGTLDVSGLTRMGMYNNFSDCSILTRILLSPFDTCIYYDNCLFDAADCSLDKWTVDDILFKFYTYYDSIIIDTCIYAHIYLNGGNNSAPTDGWGNTSIQGLYSILLPGNDVSIKINI